MIVISCFLILVGYELETKLFILSQSQFETSFFFLMHSMAEFSHKLQLSY